MPKYYVQVIDSKYLITAKDPLDACVLVSERHGVISAGITWIVSEKGFNYHFDDEAICDFLIIEELERRFNK